MNPEDLILQDLETGYYAHPEQPEAEFPPVHAVITSHYAKLWEKPLCGVEVPEGHEYLWCASTLWMPYIDCKECQRLVHEIALRQGLVRKDRLPRELSEKLHKAWGTIIS
jgi:hypothetical protein